MLNSESIRRRAAALRCTKTEQQSCPSNMHIPISQSSVITCMPSAETRAGGTYSSFEHRLASLLGKFNPKRSRHCLDINLEISLAILLQRCSVEQAAWQRRKTLNFQLSMAQC